MESNTGNSVMGQDWPSAARYCLEAGLADLIGFGRQSLADPFLPVKYAEGCPVDACRLRESCSNHFNESRPIRCEEYSR